MPVFHKAKLIHVHNPRCGGTSINRAFVSCLGIPKEFLSPKSYSYHYLFGNHRIGDDFYELDHLTFSMILEAVPRWISTEYDAFVVVRHPWDRFVSEYTRKYSTGGKRFINHKAMTFEEYCLKFLKIAAKRYSLSSPDRFKGFTHFNSCHYLPQYIYAGLDLDHAIKKPRIIKLQNISNDLPSLCGDYSEEIAKLLQKPLNSHKKKIPIALTEQISGVNKSLLRQVEKFYEKDFVLLGFQPYSKFM